MGYLAYLIGYKERIQSDNPPHLRQQEPFPSDRACEKNQKNKKLGEDRQ